MIARKVLPVVARRAVRHITAAPWSVTRSFTSTPKSLSTMDTLKTGTSAYMDLYPEKSTDGGMLKE